MKELNYLVENVKPHVQMSQEKKYMHFFRTQ